MNVFKEFKKLGLKDVTTSRQHANGTLMFKDKKCSPPIFYTFHESGYFRRRVRGYRGRVDHYQLNPTFKMFHKNRGYGMKTCRVLIFDKTEQMVRTLPLIKKYRKSHKG